jgi:predicted ArsR family transcriptional regulator
MSLVVEKRFPATSQELLLDLAHNGDSTAEEIASRTGYTPDQIRGSMTWLRAWGHVWDGRMETGTGRLSKPEYPIRWRAIGTSALLTHERERVR